MELICTCSKCVAFCDANHPIFITCRPPCLWQQSCYSRPLDRVDVIDNQYTVPANFQLFICCFELNHVMVCQHLAAWTVDAIM